MAGPAGREAVAAVWRIESARIVGALARYTGDLPLAEDLAQEALAEALVTWPRDGVPRQPAGWLLTVARRRAIDAFRRRSVRDDKYAALARGLSEGGVAAGRTPPGPGPDGDDMLWDPDQIDDDVLALMFTACHPVLSREARVALTLRVVGGLTSDEIGRSFLVPVATVQARITRAKKTLEAARVPFEVPPPQQRGERLGSVLSVIYLIFTEGSSASSGDDVIRFDLAGEAQRLAPVLSRLMPGEPEVLGLLALLELTAARFPARTGPDGQPVLLEQQDRGRWDQAAIGRGRAALTRAAASRPGPGCLRTAGGHRRVPRHRPVGRHDRLGADRAHLRGAGAAGTVARGRPEPGGGSLDGPRAGGGAAHRRPARGSGRAGQLALLPAVRGELLTRLGRAAEARAELTAAIGLCGNDSERAVLQRKVADLG